MKLGVATYAFLWTHPLAATLRQIADWGFHQVELMTAPPHLWPRDLDPDAIRALKRSFKEFSLSPVAVCPTFLDLNIASPNPGFQRESTRQILETIRLARDLEAGIVVLIPGKRHALVPQPFEDTWRTAKGAIEECAAEAERCGVVLGLENAPSLFLECAEQLCRMVREVASNSLGIVFDVANSSAEEPLPTAFELVRDHLVHVHLSDRAANSWAHLPVGQGLLDFREIFAKLQEIGFAGSSIIETTHLTEPDAGVLASKAKLEMIGWRA
jgi:deoxyribonuclease-4